MSTSDILGDRLIEENISLMKKYQLDILKKGKIICVQLDARDFNNFFYNTLKSSLLNSVKLISQPNITIPILNSGDGYFQKAFELKYVNGLASLNQTNNYINFLIASYFMFNVVMPENVIPPEYRENSFIKIYIIREHNVKDDNVGPKISTILDLVSSDTNQDIPKKGFITAFVNSNSSENYQVLASHTVNFNMNPPSYFANICMHYGTGAPLNFRSQQFDNTKPPIIGNIYVAAVKFLVKNVIHVNNVTNDPKFDPRPKINEVMNIVKPKIVDGSIETDVPIISLYSRHIIR